MWQEPIFDRTNADTFTARAGQSNIDNHKGALNYQDLNRIEGNFQYVVDKLFENSMVIPHTRRNRAEVTYDAFGKAVTQAYTDWQEQNIPWLSEIDRIRQNFNNLIALFLRTLDLPAFPSSIYLMYSEVNAWERVSLVGKTMFENMEKEYVYSGTIDCGGDRLL